MDENGGSKKRARGRPEFFQGLARYMIDNEKISAKVRDALNLLGPEAAGAKVQRHYDRLLTKTNREMEEELRASGTRPAAPADPEEAERQRILEQMACSRELRIYMYMFVTVD